MIQNEDSTNWCLSNQLVYCKRLAFVSITFLMLVTCTTASAQSSKDIKKYLDTIDKNKDGVLEVSDMAGGAKSWIQKLGFNTSKRIAINRIVAKFDRDRRKKESQKAKAIADAQPRKVPGFGVTVEKSDGVPGFSTSTTEPTRTYSESVQKQVESTFARYDRNKNGVLEKKEIERARWGSPPASQSDTNSDGNLSRVELLNRYYDREQVSRSAAEKQNSSAQQNSRRSSRWSGRDSRSRGSRTESPATPKANQFTSTAKRAPASMSLSNSGTSGSSKSAARAKLRDYVTGVFESYDKDKNGKLSKDEIKGMRRPPTGADVDGDGLVSQSELINKLSGDSSSSSSKTSASSTPSKSTGSRRSRLNRDSVRSSPRRSGSSSSFDGLDANADHQIQMHEFSGSWTSDTVKKFEDKDKNGDGVITYAEWSSSDK